MLNTTAKNPYRK